MDLYKRVRFVNSLNRIEKITSDLKMEFKIFQALKEKYGEEIDPEDPHVKEINERFLILIGDIDFLLE